MKENSLSLLAINQSLDKLNDGLAGFDLDDIYKLDRVSIVSMMGTPIRIWTGTEAGHL